MNYNFLVTKKLIRRSGIDKSKAITIYSKQKILALFQTSVFEDVEGTRPLVIGQIASLPFAVRSS